MSSPLDWLYGCKREANVCVPVPFAGHLCDFRMSSNWIDRLILVSLFTLFFANACDSHLIDSPEMSYKLATQWKNFSGEPFPVRISLV